MWVRCWTMATTNRIEVWVRNFVEFVMRSGDLVAAFGGGSRAAEGARAHRKLQKAQPPGYRPEVSLSHTVETPELTLEIKGRADGVIEEDGRVVVDEIKTTTLPLEEIGEEDNPVFWGQAKCYAYIYAVQNSLDGIGVQLTYYNLGDKTSRKFIKVFAVQELEAFFGDLVARYTAWALGMRAHIAARDASIAGLEFPYAAYRPGQRELAVAVYRTIAAGSKLFAQAPTGIGKTMAVLFPAIKALGGGYGKKLFYLTAKTVTRELAENALAALRAGGLRLKAVTLTAKEKLCFSPGAKCGAEECEFACGHFDRVGAALADIFAEPEFTRTVVEEYARKHRVCPFEFSLDLALWADCIICDYNYVFDPRVALKRFFGEGGGDFSFLVDEAHNLPDRAREMFSAELAKAPFLELRREVRPVRPRLAKALSAVNAYLLELRKKSAAAEAGTIVRQELPQDILPLLWKFVGEADTWLAQNEPAPFRDKLLELYFAAAGFLRIAELYDERYTAYIEAAGRDVRLKLFCVDPSGLLRQTMRQGRATVLFSATLAPLDYFMAMLGGEAGDNCFKVASPFPRRNLKVLLADDIGTRYKRREATYDRVVGRIAAFTRQKQGNYLIYFPSYRYLEEVYNRFTGQWPAVRTLRQTPEMSEEERAGFLAAFTAESEASLLGFAVLGGVFGEGIDLAGERLIGSVVVGVGLPQLCVERDIIRDYFAASNGAGFEYAYVYPGMNKVLQAAGRVIRTETDRGAVLLIDDRFGGGIYRRLLPEWWKPLQRVHSDRDIECCLARFWDAPDGERRENVKPPCR